MFNIFQIYVCSVVDILDLSWSPNDQWLASCSVDNSVVIWNAQKFPGLCVSLFYCTRVSITLRFHVMKKKNSCSISYNVDNGFFRASCSTERPCGNGQGHYVGPCWQICS